MPGIKKETFFFLHSICPVQTTNLFQSIGTQYFLRSDSFPWSDRPKTVNKARRNTFEKMKTLWYFQESTRFLFKEGTKGSLVLVLSELIHSFLVEIVIILGNACLISIRKKMFEILSFIRNSWKIMENYFWNYYKTICLLIILLLILKSRMSTSFFMYKFISITIHHTVNNIHSSSFLHCNIFLKVF